jgi:FtsP/CotA-like multicopper oxidase with cupredoxin domain
MASTCFQRQAPRWVCLLVFASTLAAQAGPERCPRPRIGSLVQNPAELRSSNGRLDLEFAFRTFVDENGLTRYCYVYRDSLQSPTLRVHPGDQINLTLRNELPAVSAGEPYHTHGADIQRGCTNGSMNSAATNLHFHGLDIPPACHQDETLHTLVEPSGPGFEYRVMIPKEEPPGLYWYHPHPHGYSEGQVLGGASGALIVEGIENEKPEVAGLPERIVILRDQRVPGLTEVDEDNGPGKNISINFVPVTNPYYRPARMSVRPAERQFWRVLNASADTYFDIQIRFGAIIQDVREPQTVDLIAIDGIAAGAQPKPSHILIPPGARAEFIVTTPPLGTYAQLVTLQYDTGPDGEATPYRVIANIASSKDAAEGTLLPARVRSVQPGDRVAALGSAKPVRQRKLYFSEIPPDPASPKILPQYFITVEGATPKIFDMNFKEPDITVRAGTVEDWIVENRAHEAHVFHIHQLHFGVIDRDGQSVNEPVLRDTVDVPYWDGKSSHYPSVKLRMDFRNHNIAGIFVYHCHILEHEDGGMMGSIRVRP